jgi:hypothetical protein
MVNDHGQVVLEDEKSIGHRTKVHRSGLLFFMVTNSGDIIFSYLASIPILMLQGSNQTIFARLKAEYTASLKMHSQQSLN